MGVEVSSAVGDLSGLAVIWKFLVHNAVVLSGQQYLLVRACLLMDMDAIGGDH
jgi:hypothetical protein